MLPKNEIKRIIEGALMAADMPLSINHLYEILHGDTKVETIVIQEIIAELMADYHAHGIELKQVASGYRFQISKDLVPWISKLWEEKPPRYSKALLETLTLVAYKQPITRAEIEDIRGVSVSSSLMRTLIEREWIKIVGHKDVPGRPALYTTTNKFLDYFNLKSIQELPILEDLNLKPQ